MEKLIEEITNQFNAEALLKKKAKEVGSTTNSPLKISSAKASPDKIHEEEDLAEGGSQDSSSQQSNAENIQKKILSLNV
jgi:hypothetical protein